MLPVDLTWLFDAEVRHKIWSKLVCARWPGLRFNAKTSIKPADNANDKAPDYRTLQGSVDYAVHRIKSSSEPPGRRSPARAASISRSNSMADLPANCTLMFIGPAKAAPD